MPDAAAAQPYLDAARRLAPKVRAAREEAERLRHMPHALAAEITAAGLFQLYLPRSMGGPEIPPLPVFDIVEEISRHDGSVGWCVMIALAMAMNVARLPAEVGRELAGTPADYRAAGSARVGGTCEKVPGGWRMRGRWNFASGVENARWLYCTCVELGDDGKPLVGANGKPVLRALFVPREQVTILDTWHVMGMRGTGSRDFTVEEVTVPEHRTVRSDATPPRHGPMYHPRTWYSIVWTPSAANAIGIARGAIDALQELAQSEASTLSTALLRDRPAVQATIGEAEAILSAARAYVVSAIGALWETLRSGREPSDAEVMHARLAITHGMRESARVVDKVFHAAGTNAIYTTLPLERCFRDIHVAIQHGSCLPSFYESAGKVMVGLRPTDFGW